MGIQVRVELASSDSDIPFGYNLHTVDRMSVPIPDFLKVYIPVFKHGNGRNIDSIFPLKPHENPIQPLYNHESIHV